MKKVIVFRDALLLPSETFIKEQALALTDWQPVLVGYRSAPGGLDLTGLDVRLLPYMTSSRLSRWRTKLAQWRGRPHPPTVRALKTIGADLLHAHFGTDATDIWPSVKAAGLPMIVTLHGYDINIYREWWEAGHGGWRRRAYPRRLLAMAQEPTVHFIAVSKAIRQRAIEYGISEEKIAVAYIGVNTARFKPGGLPLAQRKKRILFVGRMVEKKAPLLMIQAFAEVRKAVPDAELVMVGTGPLLNDAQRLATELAAPVTFLGACTSDEVLEQMHQARVFCLPSVVAANGDAEGFGMVLLEAQACGVPVVSSARGGASEGIRDRITGYQLDPNNSAQFTYHISTILTDDVKVLSLSATASVFIEQHFDVARLTKHLESTYSQTTMVAA